MILHETIIIIGAAKGTPNAIYYNFDIALIKLRNEFKGVVPICIENDFAKDLKKEISVTTSSWRTLNKNVPKDLMYQQLVITEEKSCACTSPKHKDWMDKFIKGCNAALDCLMPNTPTCFKPKEPEHYFCINKGIACNMDYKKVRFKGNKSSNLFIIIF